MDQIVPTMELEDLVTDADISLMPEQLETPLKSRKRRLDDDLDRDEEYDNFGENDACVGIRRGRKEGRRVSGVYREIRALHNIGRDAEVMDKVFCRMSISEVLKAGGISSMWYIVALRVLRKRLLSSPFLRLFASDESVHARDGTEQLIINWELHFHDQLLSGNQEEIDCQMEHSGNTSNKEAIIPGIQAILTVGNRNAFLQLTHENAKLPFRQEHMFAICQDAIFTSPNNSFIDTVSNGFNRNVAVQSLFVPTSQYFTVTGFGLQSTAEPWTESDVRGKIEVPIEDLSPGQTLKAVLLVSNCHTSHLHNFLEVFQSQFADTALLTGDAEEIGYNRAQNQLMAVGYSFYASPGANIEVYTVDFMKENSIDILRKMEKQVTSKKYSFGFIFSHDRRELLMGPEDVEDEWGLACPTIPQQPSVEEVLQNIHSMLPNTSFVGVKSYCPVIAKPTFTNAGKDSSDSFTFGFILCSYDQ